MNVRYHLPVVIRRMFNPDSGATIVPIIAIALVVFFLVRSLTCPA